MLSLKRQVSREQSRKKSREQNKITDTHDHRIERDQNFRKHLETNSNPHLSSIKPVPFVPLSNDIALYSDSHLDTVAKSTKDVTNSITSILESTLSLCIKDTNDNIRDDNPVTGDFEKDAPTKSIVKENEVFRPVE